MSAFVKYIAIALAIVGGLALIGLAFHAADIAALPPRIECRDQADAQTQATAWIAAHGGELVPVVGTGSMAPYIPAAAPGSDPRTTIVAYAVIDSSAYALVHTGDLCVYVAEWSHTPTIHQVVEQDPLGWIMSGLHNARSETAWRMTEANFIGRVITIFTWPPL